MVRTGTMRGGFLLWRLLLPKTCSVVLQVENRREILDELSWACSGEA